MEGNFPDLSNCFSYVMGATKAFFIIWKLSFLVVKFIMLVICFTFVVLSNFRIWVEIPSHSVTFLRLNLFICLLTIKLFPKELNSKDDGSVRFSLIFNIRW